MHHTAPYHVWTPRSSAPTLVVTPLELAVGLAALILGLGLLARQLRTPRPIVLATGGVGIGVLAHFVPGLPRLTLEPRLILGLVLPPLLAGAAIRAAREELDALAAHGELRLAEFEHLEHKLESGMGVRPGGRAKRPGDDGTSALLQALTAERETIRPWWNGGRLQEDSALRLEAALDLAEMSARGISRRILGNRPRCRVERAGGARHAFACAPSRSIVSTPYMMAAVARRDVAGPFLALFGPRGHARGRGDVRTSGLRQQRNTEGTEARTEGHGEKR